MSVDSNVFLRYLPLVVNICCPSVTCSRIPYHPTLFHCILHYYCIVDYTCTLGACSIEMILQLIHSAILYT